MMLVLLLALLAAAAVLSIATKWKSLAWARVQTPTAWLLTAAAAAIAVVVGARGLAGAGDSIDLGDLGGLGSASLSVDRLSGLFLVISCGVAVPVLLAAATVDSVDRPRLPAVAAFTVAAIVVIETADHLFVVLFGWEALTFAFYLLAGFDRDRSGRARASVATATFGKASGAALLAGGAILAAQTGHFDLAGFADAHGPGRQAGYGLLLFGFAIKVGIVPMQVWLPPAYAAAPPPVRGLMAGAAVNVGFYGMWRTLQELGHAPVWLATLTLVIAGITAVLGISHAAVTHDLAELIAWSSVENAGVITAGFGVALVGSNVGNTSLMAAGLLAATAQVCAHALGKSLLFTATAAVEHAAGTTDLDKLRGVARRMPFAGAGLVIGSLTLAGMPLTAGFASEWFTLQSLMQQFRVSRLPLQLGAATAGALVALTVGVAGVTFVRLIALTAFGRPDTVPVDRARADRRGGHRVGIVALSVGCFGAAALAPWEVRMFVNGLEPLVGERTRGALSSPWVLQPVFADFSSLSPSWLWIVVPALTLSTALVALCLSGSRLWRVRQVPVWSSGSPGVDRGVGYTSFGWANPMRKVLANLLLTRGQLAAEQAALVNPYTERGTVEGDDTETGSNTSLRRGDNPSSAPDLPSAVAGGLRYKLDVVEIVEHFLYRPALRALLRITRIAKRLQSGRLDAYMAYMLIALIAVLAVVAGTA